MAIDLHLSERILGQLLLRLKADRVRQRLVDVVDRILERPQGALANGVDAANVQCLVETAHHAINEVLEAKIGDQHGRG